MKRGSGFSSSISDTEAIKQFSGMIRPDYIDVHRLPLYRTQRGVQHRCPHGAPPDSSGGERTAAGATMVSSTERLDASYQFSWGSRSLEVVKLR